MKRIKTISANEQVFNYMKEAIIGGEWKIGDKIPSENKLADTFGVNRLTVRMALKKLVALGILETKTGDGTYVRGFQFEDYIQQISEFYMTPELMQSVFDFRKAVEIECARLAINNGTEEEIAKLAEICEDFQHFKKTYAGDSEEYLRTFVEKDVMFHKQIIAMSHNELFQYSYDVALEPIQKYIFMLVKSRIDSWNKKGISSSNWNDQHKEIYEAIHNKDFESCKNAMLKMVDFTVDLSSEF